MESSGETQRGNVVRAGGRGYNSIMMLEPYFPTLEIEEKVGRNTDWALTSYGKCLPAILEYTCGPNGTDTVTEYIVRWGGPEADGT